MQQLFGRRTKTVLPTTFEKLQAESQPLAAERQHKEDKKSVAAEYFNRHSKDLPPLKPGERIAADSHWSEGLAASYSEQTAEKQDI